MSKLFENTLCKTHTPIPKVPFLIQFNFSKANHFSVDNNLMF